MRRELTALLLVGLLGCEESSSSASTDAGRAADAGAAVDAAPPRSDAGPEVARARANLKFKGGARLRNELARALDLEPDAVCNELGRFDCATFVHTVTLGGVDAYQRGLYLPLPQSPVTAPLALDRLVLSACGAATERDLGDGPAVIWRELPIDAGRLDVDAAAVAEAIDRLYRRALLRPATEAEVGHLRDLYRAIEARGGAQPAHDWTKLACFAVLTTLEAVFY